MKRIILAAAITLISQMSFSQIVSKFSWDGSSATVAGADFGPNASSVSSSAVASLVGHSSGIPNYALSAGTGSKDLNLTLPNTSYFNIPSMDFSVDFRREESEASLLSRGSLFDFGMKSGKLSIKFSVTNELGSATTINADGIYNIPNDGLFHRYRFAYDNLTGIANVWVDGTARYSYAGVTNRAMYWTGAGNPVVGRLMDGTGKNVGLIDNLEWRIFSVAVVLPVSFKSVNATADASGKNAKITWVTEQESNIKYYEVQGSDDGIEFKSITRQMPSINLNGSASYQATDFGSNAIRYYRILAVDNDGKVSFSTIKSVEFLSGRNQVKVYPNPALDHINISMPVSVAAKFHYKIFSREGRLLQTGVNTLSQGNAKWTIMFQPSVPKNSIITIIIENETQTAKSVLQVIRK
jgi:hypothetical protein